MHDTRAPATGPMILPSSIAFATSRRFSGSAPSGSGGGFAFGAKYIGQVASVLPTAAAAATAAPAGGEAIKAAAIIPADLDGELSQQLQKLSKRDATTKLKALQAGGRLKHISISTASLGLHEIASCDKLPPTRK
jgi:hypothetical protein